MCKDKHKDLISAYSLCGIQLTKQFDQHYFWPGRRKERAGLGPPEIAQLKGNHAAASSTTESCRAWPTHRTLAPADPATPSLTPLLFECRHIVIRNRPNWAYLSSSKVHIEKKTSLQPDALPSGRGNHKYNACSIHLSIWTLFTTDPFTLSIFILPTLQESSSNANGSSKQLIRRDNIKVKPNVLYLRNF